jgi:Mg-chelatase subunit ChlD
MRNALLVGVAVLGACGSPAPAAAPAEPLSNMVAATPVDPSSVALVFVIDRSGSMQGPRMAATREAIGRIAAGLPEQAEFGLIAFDSAATVLVPLTRAGDRDAIAAGVGTLEAGGGTHYLPGLVSARELLAGSAAAHKHVIFLSDGEAAYEGVVEAAASLRADGATVSTVAVPGADERLLAMIADAGGGRPIVVDDVARLATALEAEVAEVTGP